MLSDSRFCRKVGIAGPCIKVYTVKYIFNRIKQVEKWMILFAYIFLTILSEKFPIYSIVRKFVKEKQHINNIDIMAYIP